MTWWQGLLLGLLASFLSGFLRAWWADRQWWFDLIRDVRRYGL